MRHGVVLVLALVVGGCNRLPGLHSIKDPPPSVHTTAASYKAGATGGVVVANHGAHTIGFNSCPIALEQLSGSAWRAAPGGVRGPATIAECSTSFLLVGSGDSVETRFTLAPSVAPGTYRLRLTRVEGRDASMGADSTGARTNQFTVTP